MMSINRPANATTIACRPVINTPATFTRIVGTVLMLLCQNPMVRDSRLGFAASHFRSALPPSGSPSP